MPTPSDEPQPTKSSTAGCFVRLIWMIIGPVFAVISVVSIYFHRGDVSYRDLMLLAAVFMMLGARYIDITMLGGATVTGERASFSVWKRYALSVSLMIMLAWIAAYLFSRIIPR